MTNIYEELKERPTVYSRFGNGLEASKPVLNRKPSNQHKIMYHNLAQKSKLKKKDKFKEFIKQYDNYKKEVHKIRDTKQYKVKFQNLRNQFLALQEPFEAFEKKLPVFKTVNRDKAIQICDPHERTPTCTHYNPNFSLKEKKVKGFLDLNKQKSPKCLLFTSINNDDNKQGICLTERESMICLNQDLEHQKILPKELTQSFHQKCLTNNKSENNLNLLNKSQNQQQSSQSLLPLKDQPFTKQKKRELISEVAQKFAQKLFANNDCSKYFPDIYQQSLHKSPRFDLFIPREALPDNQKCIKVSDRDRSFIPIQKRFKKWPDASNCFKKTRELFMKYHKNFSIIL